MEMGKRLRQRIQQKCGQQPGQHQPALCGKMYRLADDIGQQQHGQAPLKHHLRSFLAKCFIDLARAAQPSAQAQQQDIGQGNADGKQQRNKHFHTQTIRSKKQDNIVNFRKTIVNIF